MHADSGTASDGRATTSAEEDGVPMGGTASGREPSRVCVLE